MRSYSETSGFTDRAQDLLREAQGIVSLIPDPAEGRPCWRCHEVAHAVGDLLGLKVVDGMFGSVEHSWLVIPDGCSKRDGDAILDVYAVGVLPQVLLVSTYAALPHHETYCPAGRPAHLKIRWDDVEEIKRSVVAARAGASV